MRFPHQKKKVIVARDVIFDENAILNDNIESMKDGVKEMRSQVFWEKPRCTRIGPVVILKCFWSSRIPGSIRRMESGSTRTTYDESSMVSGSN